MPPRTQACTSSTPGSENRLTALQPAHELREAAASVVLVKAERRRRDAVMREKPGCATRILSGNQVGGLQDPQCP
jgi:hypothetical protein